MKDGVLQALQVAVVHSSSPRQGKSEQALAGMQQTEATMKDTVPKPATNLVPELVLR
jgi:hypothetical protein